MSEIQKLSIMGSKHLAKNVRVDVRMALSELYPNGYEIIDDDVEGSIGLLIGDVCPTPLTPFYIPSKPKG